VGSESIEPENYDGIAKPIIWIIAHSAHGRVIRWLHLSCR